MNIGILGGTFDPIHLGHLAVAEEALRRASLSKIIFVPAGQPYFKAGVSVSPARDRLNMLKLAVQGKAVFRISQVEIKRAGPSYAVDTLAQLKKRFNTGDELYFILGWDSLLTLPLWHQAERLISLCRLIAASRPGYIKPDLSLLEKDLAGISERTLLLDQPVIDISSTQIRRRVLQGRNIEHLVPPAVAGYIGEHGLYRSIAE